MIVKLERAVRLFTNILCYIGMALLLALMLIGAIDVVGRYALNRPMKGVYEISEVLLAGIVFFGLAYALSRGGHVAVDTLVNLLPCRTRAIVGFIMSSLALTMFVLMGWQGTRLALKSWQSHRVIDVLFIPIAPFQLLVPIGVLAVCLELAIQMLHYYAAVRKEF